MSKRRITLTLTPGEVEALRLALLATMGSSDWQEQLAYFGSARMVRCAERAADAVQAAQHHG